MTIDWTQLGQELIKVPGLMKEIYGDLAKPGVKQAGKALETVLGLGNTVLLPIQLANEKSRIHIERNLKDYAARLQNLPDEKVVPVAPEIGVPVVEKLAYVSDTKLADMYISLLTKASNVDTLPEVHPSFVNIINNLSPDEAQMLKVFLLNQAIEFVTAKWQGPDISPHGWEKKHIFRIARDLLVAPEHQNNLTFPQNMPAYLSNLEGLGLISINHSLTIDNSKNYAIMEKYWSDQFPAASAPKPDWTLEFERGMITTTEFGLKFIHACHAMNKPVVLNVDS